MLYRSSRACVGCCPPSPSPAFITGTGETKAARCAPPASGWRTPITSESLPMRRMESSICSPSISEHRRIIAPHHGLRYPARHRYLQSASEQLRWQRLRQQIANLALTGDATNVESLRGNLVGGLLRAHLRPVPVRNDNVIPAGH